MWLPWQPALLIAAALFMGARVTAGYVDWRRHIREFCHEASFVFVLYAVWRIVGKLSILQTEGAVERAHQIWDLQGALLMPSEATVQSWILPHPWLVQASNIYYAGAHVPAAIALLLWLWVWHRDHYPRTRNALAAVTAACLAIQLLPVAPPRLIPELGIVDTAKLYNQSVYVDGGLAIPGQVQAMPSIHAAWAFVVGVVVWQVASGRWRWVGPFHAAMTFIVIALTGNHFWLDGIVAGLLLGVIMAVQARRGRRAGLRAPEDPAVSSSPVLV